eukprot:Gb_38921 [translate_table: standard]
MLMHASRGAEVEDAPKEEPLQGIDTREPLQTCPLEMEGAIEAIANDGEIRSWIVARIWRCCLLRRIRAPTRETEHSSKMAEELEPWYSSAQPTCVAIAVKWRWLIPPERASQTGGDREPVWPWMRRGDVRFRLGAYVAFSTNRRESLAMVDSTRGSLCGCGCGNVRFCQCEPMWHSRQTTDEAVGLNVLVDPVGSRSVKRNRQESKQCSSMSSTQACRSTRTWKVGGRTVTDFVKGEEPTSVGQGDYTDN